MMTLRLRLISSVLFCHLAIVGQTFAQSGSAQTGPGQLTTLSRQQLDVIKVLVAQEKAWNRGDIEGFASGYKDSPDTLFVGRQISRGYQQMLEDYKKNYPTKEAMGTLSFTELEAHPLDDRFTLVLGKYKLERSKKAGGNADGVFSLILEKTEKGWKVVVDHTT
jgi:ketosteroid isomerase-like protein